MCGFEGRRCAGERAGVVVEEERLVVEGEGSERVVRVREVVEGVGGFVVEAAGGVEVAGAGDF